MRKQVPHVADRGFLLQQAMLEASSPKGRYPQSSSVEERAVPIGMPPEICRMQEELAHMKDRIFEDEWDRRNEAALPPQEG